MEAKLKHLEFIQNAINRMANNSFLLKGWSVTIVGGLAAFSFKELDRRYVFISIVVISVFWLLDGYYLAQERAFVKLYDVVRRIDVSEIDFGMNSRQFRGRYGWVRCAFSTTLILFYGGLFSAVLIIIFNL
jgi:hypothetical protein